MKQWEYKIVKPNVMEGKLYIYDEDRKPYDAAMMMTDMGARGWELTGTTTFVRDSVSWAYLVLQAREKNTNNIPYKYVE